jgi:hypothetical protein
VAAYREVPWDDAVTLVYGACAALTDGMEPGTKILDTVVRRTKESGIIESSGEWQLLVRWGQFEV